MSKQKDGGHKENKLAKDMEITKEEADKLNEELEKTSQGKQECQTKATKEAWEKGEKQGRKAISDFQDPDLLKNIKIELDKDHIGDDKAKLFLFACACSSRLIPDNRFSTAITGDSSEGKDNLWKTIHRHLPDGWFLDLTRTTIASLEDDVKKFNCIYIGEGNFKGGSNAPIIDTFKQLVEDGIRTLKKDIRKDHKKSRFENQPRKVGIYSTTEDSSDEELATRFCVISVHGSPGKYRLVNENTKKIASNTDLQIDRIERKEKPTWIQNGLKTLKNFDIINIPYAELLEVECRVARSQRDFKRFLNLIRSLAWIRQHNRVQYEYRGCRILVVSAEDFYDAMEIGKEIFDQSLSGFEPRLQRIMDSYKKIVKENSHLVNRDVEGAEKELNWIDRSLIQKDLGIKKRETVQKHIETLTDLNFFTYFNKGNRTYVALKFIDSPSDSPSIYPLITVPKNYLYTLIHDNEDQILNELLDGKRAVKWSLASPDKKICSNILSLTPDRPSISQKNVYTEHELSIIKTLKQKMDGKKWTVDKKQEDPQKNLDQISDLSKINDFCHQFKDNNGFVKEKSILTFIKSGLRKADPDKYYQILLEKGILTFNPGKGVSFTGGM